MKLNYVIVLQRLCDVVTPVVLILRISLKKSKFIELYIKNLKLCSLLLLGVACVFYRELHKPLAFSTFRAKFTKNLFVKELSFCHKLYFSNLYIFATQCRRPLIFQTMNSVKSKFEILALEGASRPSSNCEHVLFVYIVKQNKETEFLSQTQIV